jgi:hypothetical protein
MTAFRGACASERRRGIYNSPTEINDCFLIPCADCRHTNGRAVRFNLALRSFAYSFALLPCCSYPSAAAHSVASRNCGRLAACADLLVPSTMPARVRQSFSSYHLAPGSDLECILDNARIAISEAIRGREPEDDALPLTAALVIFPFEAALVGNSVSDRLGTNRPALALSMSRLSRPMGCQTTPCIAPSSSSTAWLCSGRH